MPDRASRWRVKVRSNWGRGVGRWAEARRAGRHADCPIVLLKVGILVGQNAARTFGAASALRRLPALQHA